MSRISPLILLFTFLVGCDAGGAKEYNRGLDALRSNQLEQAEASFLEAIDENDDFGEAHFNLGSTQARRAKAFLESGKEEEAFAKFTRAIESLEKALQLLEQGHFLLVLEESERTPLLTHLKSLLADWKTNQDDVQAIKHRILSIDSKPSQD